MQQRITFHANIAQASLRAGSASHPSRTFGGSLEVIICHRGSTTAPEISMTYSSTILPEIYRRSLARRPVFSLVRHLLIVRPWRYREAPAAGESFGAHICPIPCSLCHPMPSHVHPYPHSPPGNVATLPAPINCTYSRSSGAFGLAEQGLPFEYFFLIQNFQTGWERL